jgi:hypothetical protein
VSSSRVRENPFRSFHLQQKQRAEEQRQRLSNFVTPVFSRRVACGIRLQFRARFVQFHGAVIQEDSIQRLDSRVGFSRIGHFNESETARSTGVTVLHDGDRFNRSVGGEKIFQLRFRGRQIQVSNEDVRQNIFADFSVSSSLAGKKRKGDLCRYRLFAGVVGLESLHVFGLPTLGPLSHVELHRLAFLQAFEPAGLDGRKMHKNVFASLTANEAVAFCVVEPLNCSLFHVYLYSYSFAIVTLEGIGRKLAQVTGCSGESCSRPSRSNAHRHRTRGPHN